MVKVYLARHGQTEENLARIFQGQLHGRLTEEGKLQAVELGAQLKEVQLDAIVSSDLQRVTDTVALAVGDRNLPWEKLPLLREIDWGSLTGRKIDEVDRSVPFPKDVETKEELYERAGRCVDYLRQHYEGKTILVVAHGLINRSLQAQATGVPMRRLATIPHMKNAEVRAFVL